MDDNNWLAETESTNNCYKNYSNINPCPLVKQKETCKCVNRSSDMHQVRWLALVGLSLVLLVLILVHFTFFGTLLVRFYRRKNNNAQ
jgi:hypothetical protein